jgi:hypothetical protein
MLYRLFTAFIVIVAIVVGLLNISSFAHVDVVRLSMFSEFFSVAIPILGFGALIKYLCTCSGCSKGKCGCGGKCSCGSGRCCCGASSSMPRT